MGKTLFNRQKIRNKNAILKCFTSIISFLLVFTLIPPVASNASGNLKQDLSDESILQMKRAITQNAKLSVMKPQLHVDLQSLKGDQDVSVIVHFSEKPVAIAQGISTIEGKKFTSMELNEVKEDVSSQQAKALNKIRERKLIVKEGYSFDTVLNAVAMTVKASHLNYLLNVEGVVMIEPDSERVSLTQPNTEEVYSSTALSNSTARLGVEDLWELNYFGETIKVGVIDTGIDYFHPEFEGIYKGGHNFVPNSTDYLYERAADDPYETTPAERPFNKTSDRYHTTQGTRSAGIIAAIGANDHTIKGVAPKVDLHVYRVLGAYGKGMASWVVAGIEKAVEEKMDVITLSASGPIDDSTTSDAMAINNAMLAGTLAVVGAGDNQDDAINSPGTAEMALTVGNSTSPIVNITSDVSFKTEDFESQMHLPIIGWKYGKHPKDVLTGEYDLVIVPGVGNPIDYENINVEGKVAFVSYSISPFEGLVKTAQKNGAIAVIQYKVDAGPPSFEGYFGEDLSLIPALTMSYEEGQTIREALAVHEGKVSFSNILTTETGGNNVPYMSGIGPVGHMRDIKPDVVAPGTKIMTTIPAFGKDNPDASYANSYELSTGTIIAASHVAGIAALLIQVHPEWTPFDVKLALANTAEQMDFGINGRISVYRQGSGLVNANRAAFPDALAYVADTLQASTKTVENRKGTLSFGDVYQTVYGTASVSKQLIIKDLKGVPDDYTVSIEIDDEASDSTTSAKIEVDKTKFTLKGEQVLNVTLSVPPGRGLGYSNHLGYVHITNGTTKLSLPFAARILIYPNQVSELRLDHYDLSFNGDGVEDSTSLRYRSYGSIGENYVEIMDVMNPESGYYGDGSLGFVSMYSSIPANTYMIEPIIGTYYDWETGSEMLIPDGMYTLNFTGFHESNPTEYSQAWTGPLVVKKTAATITTTSSLVTKTNDMEFKGKIVDKYLDYNEVWDLKGPNYGLNYLFKSYYKLESPTGELINEGGITFEENGTFVINLATTVPGNNKLEVYIRDIAGNIGTQEFILVNETMGVPPSEPLPQPTIPESGPSGEPFKPVEETLDDNVLEPQLNDSTKQKVTVEVTPLTILKPEVNVKIQAKSLNSLAKSSKSLEIISGVIEVEIPNQVLKNISANTPESATVTLKNINSQIKDNSSAYEIAITYIKDNNTTKLTKLTEPIELTVFVPSIKDSRKVAAYRIIDSFDTPQYDYLGGTYFTNKKLNFKTNVLSKFVVIENNKTFTDIQGHWAKDQIEVLASRTITSGKTDTTFSPNGKITRAEFAVLIARALNLPIEEYNGTFNDVTKSKAWAYAGIEAANRAGIVSGKTKESFDPDALITRQEIAAMVVRGVKYKNASLLKNVDTSKTFVDDKAIGDFAKESVKQAVGLGIVSGRSGNQFDPKANATRAESVVMLYRTLDKLNAFK